jgi:hypothetical protein
MEVKINKEVRGYTEAMFFGLTLRQCAFSALAVVTAVLLHFSLRGALGLETVSWLCLLGAAPFGAAGFVTYNGMTAERFIWAYIKSELIMPRRLLFKAVNMYELLMAAPKPKKGPKPKTTKEKQNA